MAQYRIWSIRQIHHKRYYATSRGLYIDWDRRWDYEDWQFYRACTKQSKEEEFTNQAIAAFQAKAKNIAKSFGANAYTLVNVSVNSAEDEYGNRRNSMMMVSASSISGTLPSSMGQDQDSSYISPRESKIAVTIQGSIQLIQ